jgi:septum formation protein
MTDIILASASPRRQELLSQIGVRFRQQVAEVDESRFENESAGDYVARVALEKARAIQGQFGHDGMPVLGADTAVVIDDRVLGKPDNADHAGAMLRMLSARMHRVLSAVAVIRGDREAVQVHESSVWFRSLSASEIDAYWRSGEPRDKAGAYAIQGIGAIFVERLEGSYSGVMGLPLFETARLLRAFGIRVLEQ